MSELEGSTPFPLWIKHLLLLLLLLLLYKGTNISCSNILLTMRLGFTDRIDEFLV